MDKNAIITVIEDIVSADRLEYISGSILNCGTSDCALSDERGSVYGIAIELSGDEKQSFFDNLANKKKGVTAKEWKSIGDNYYPLYWGIDINMGARLSAHIKDYLGTGALQLNARHLGDFKIIYGAIPCLNRAKHEKTLRNTYPDILKTIKKSSSKE
ncbi:MAG: hypothetical protein IJ515_03445 [Clostridia bacterium]|nr:hypothetical protein [Clostridia bacterium]